MSKPAFTLLLIQPERLVRADFAGGATPRLVNLYESAPPEVDSLAIRVEAALRAGPGEVRKVWVLASEWWTQTVRMSAQGLAGVRGEALARALAYEAEAMSGVPAAEAVLGVSELPTVGGEAGFWITLGTRQTLASVDETLRRLGVRLQGMAHPAGCPLATGARVELWSDLVLMRDAAGRVSVINSDPRFVNWAEEAARFFRDSKGETGQVEAWIARPGVDARGLPEGLAAVDLGDEAVLRRWLEGWGAVLQGERRSAPVMRPPARPVSPQLIPAAALALLLLTCGGCWWVNRELRAHQAELGAKLKEAEGARQRLVQLNKQAQDAQKLATETRAEVGRLRALGAQRERVVEAHRRRVGLLLRSLGEALPADVMLSRIEAARGGNGSVVIHGMSLRSEDANALASGLSRSVDPEAWRVLPPVKKSIGVSLGGGPYRFELTLEQPAFEWLAEYRSESAAAVAQGGPDGPNGPGAGRAASGSESRASQGDGAAGVRTPVAAGGGR